MKTHLLNLSRFQLITKLRVLAAIFIGSVAGMATYAQTCRVSVGVSDSGVRNYIEVFEYDYVSEKPAFPGGDSKLTEFINTHRKYPKEAYDKGIQGRVTCSFIVNTDGSVSNINVVRSVNVALNAEALRIFGLMPCWLPGKINGQAVPVRVIRSIPFRK